VLFQVTGHSVPTTRQSLFEFAALGAPVELALVPREYLELPSPSDRQALLDPRRWSHDSVYLLLGAPAQPWQIYVGSASDPLRRLEQHHREKDWWQRALLCSTPSLAQQESQQVERRIGRALEAHGGELVELMSERLPRENPDHAISVGVRRVVFPAIEHTLHTLGLPVTLGEA
jgi:hypothetical protein